ncbi:MAG: hypothetical protein ABIF71_10475 [Planctomycetota bacterium]
MNAVLGGFLSFLTWAWTVIAAVLLIVIGFYPGEVQTFVAHPYFRSLTVLLGCGLVLLAYLVVRSVIARTHHRREIVYTNELGEVSVSLNAIEEALSQVLARHSVIRDHEVTITTDGGPRLNVNAKVFIEDIHKITLKGAEIQQLLARRFEEIIPDTEIPHIRVKIVNFCGPEPETRPVSAQGPDPVTAPTLAMDENITDETDYFTGLKYPIETGDEDEDDDEDEDE